MSAPQGCNDDMGVVESFKEALKGRVGADRFRMWFTHGIEFSLQAQTDSDARDNSIARADSAARADLTAQGNSETVGTSSALVASSSDAASPFTRTRPAALIVSVRGQFALDRLRKNFLSEIRGAAMQACGNCADVQLRLDEPQAHQVELPLDGPDASHDVSQDKSAQRANVDECSNLDAHSGAQKTNRHGKSGRPGETARRGSARSLGGYLNGSATHPGASSARVTSQRGARRNTRQLQAKRTVDGVDPIQLELPEFETDSAAGNDEGLIPSAPQTRQAVAQQRAATVNRDQGTEQDKPSVDAGMTSANFIPGNCNRLAHTAMVMACQDPSTATPLFLCGPTGTGKTHLLNAIADQLRRRYRLRRVVHLSAEQFTNDFISSVGNSGITAFRRRYREVDALLVDDVQFLGSKKATLREMLYTVETLAGSGRPLIFAGSEAPTEIQGLSRELAGRMASGLVCTLQPLDSATREKLLRRWVDERCHLEVPETLIESINPLLAGDGRVISGVVNVLRTLQRMLQRTPSLDELKQFGGQLLRAARPLTTLGLIESAVCEAFQLPPDALRGKSQTRAITGPRMLAMYLSRQMTPAAYAEIARHFGGRSHSTAISAEHQVKSWLEAGGQVGRGRSAMSAREAIDRIETLLRTG